MLEVSSSSFDDVDAWVYAMSYEIVLLRVLDENERWFSVVGTKQKEEITSLDVDHESAWWWDDEWNKWLFTGGTR